MTPTLATLLPPAAVALVQEIDRTRGREVAVALVDFLVWADVREWNAATVERLDPNLRAGKPAMRPKEESADDSGKTAEQLSLTL